MQGTQVIDRDSGAGSAEPAALPGHRPIRWPQERQKARLFAGLTKALLQAIATRRIFVLLPFCMIAGLVCYAALPAEPETWALAGAGCVVIGLTIALRNAAWAAWLWLALAFWFGFVLLAVHGAASGTPMLVHPAFGTYQMRVDAVVSATAESRRIIVSAFEPVAGSRVVPVAGARLVVQAEPPLAAGDIIEAELRLAPVPGPILPGAYDGQFHSYFDGVGAYGNVIGDLRIVSAGSALNLSRAIEGLRADIANRIGAVLEGDTAAIGQAMVMGDQSALSDATRDVMAASGLAHIYSISGLHLSIVAGGVFWLVRLGLAALPGVSSRYPIKRVAALAGIVMATGYMLLAGGVSNVPALRSAVMLALIFGAVLAGRRALTMRNVAIAAIAIIIIDPASVLRASFQLSFAAVVALIGVYELPRRPPMAGQTGCGLRVGSVVWATAATSFIAGSATLLFSAYHFQQTAPLGVVANVLVLPVVSLVIMPFAVLSVLAMPFGMEAPFVTIMGWGIDQMVGLAVLVASWSAGLTGNPLLADRALLVGLVALAWFSFVPTWWRLAAPAVAAPVILLFCFEARPDILIADTTQAVAVRGAEGLALVSGRTGSFAVDAWADHYQEPIAELLPEARCDGLGCIVTTKAFSVAVVRNAAAFAEDCGAHDLLVARLKAPATCVGLVIDRNDLALGGVHWLHWNAAAGRFDVRTAIPNITRPWRAWLQ